MEIGENPKKAVREFAQPFKYRLFIIISQQLFWLHHQPLKYINQNSNS